MSFQYPIVQGMPVMKELTLNQGQASTPVECVVLILYMRPYEPTGPARHVPPLAQLTQNRVPKWKISQQH